MKAHRGTAPCELEGDEVRVPGKHKARFMQARCSLQADAKPAWHSHAVLGLFYILTVEQAYGVKFDKVKIVKKLILC